MADQLIGNVPLQVTVSNYSRPKVGPPGIILELIMDVGTFAPGPKEKQKKPYTMTFSAFRAAHSAV
jgi:hypothetical protein